MLEVTRLNAWYGRAHILYDVSLQAGAGEVVALLGRNGAGKSTLLRAVLGLVPRREGEVRLDGRPVTHLRPYRVARLGLGWVPEDRRVFTRLTVAQNLLVARRQAAGTATPWTPERLFRLFPNLAELQDRPAGRISGGEQQMLAIARTLAGNPRLVMLDEPSEGLAPRIVTQMAEAIHAMRGEGLSVLLSEQNLPFARGVSDRAAIIEQGHIRYTGTMAELEADPVVRDEYLAV